MRLWGRLFIVLPLSLFLTSCTKKVVVRSATSVPEETYCSDVQSYTGLTSTVTGKGVYKRRELTSSSGLGAVEATDYPIRYAEVQVKNASGAIVQCTETDNNGDFSFIVPQSGAYTVYINSRGYNSFVRASVLNLPSENIYYSISTAFSANSGSVNVGTVVAPATGTVTGGAFNIFDQILKANEFLSSQTGNCSVSITGCLNFTVAPKIQAYWIPGFNPATLYNSSSLLSFYVQGTSQLFILGGSKSSGPDYNDINTSDTDHFDNSVIIHEYGHFIEDIYSKTDSPGGYHDANSIIDPRLAWGEAWANFFSLAVTGDPVYRDSYGTIDGSTSYFFNHNLETNSPSRDVANQAGEGNFREFAITRTLWDGIDPHPVSGATTDADGIQAPFREFWHIFTSTFKNSGVFRDFGLFMNLHSQLSGGTNLSSILSAEFQKSNREDYAYDISSTSKSCGTSIRALTGYGEDGTYSNSNQFNSNDFYLYYHSGGTLTVNLTYGPTSDDLDLWIYKEGYTFGSNPSTYTLAVSANDPPSSESVSISAPQGYYLINVNYYTGSTSPLPWPNITYNLTVGGAACP